MPAGTCIKTYAHHEGGATDENMDLSNWPDQVRNQIIAGTPLRSGIWSTLFASCIAIAPRGVDVREFQDVEQR